MKLISNAAGALGIGAGGRKGRSRSSAGQVVNRPQRRIRKASTAGHRRNRRIRVLTIGARCSVISPDCIQNVGNWQLQAPPDLLPSFELQGELAWSRLRPAAPPSELEAACHSEAALSPW